MRAFANLPPEPRRVLRPSPILAGLHQELFRHAADIDAGAAPEAPLGDPDPRAMSGGNAGASNARRSAADHEQVEIVTPFRAQVPIPPIVTLLSSRNSS